MSKRLLTVANWLAVFFLVGCKDEEQCGPIDVTKTIKQDAACDSSPLTGYRFYHVNTGCMVTIVSNNC